MLFAVQPGKVVILLTGRYAGKKAVIVRNYDEGTTGRKYGHAVVCGLSKEPRKVSNVEDLQLIMASFSLFFLENLLKWNTFS